MTCERRLFSAPYTLLSRRSPSLFASLPFLSLLFPLLLFFPSPLSALSFFSPHSPSFPSFPSLSLPPRPLISLLAGAPYLPSALRVTSLPPTRPLQVYKSAGRHTGPLRSHLHSRHHIPPNTCLPDIPTARRHTGECRCCFCYAHPSPPQSRASTRRGNGAGHECSRA